MDKLKLEIDKENKFKQKLDDQIHKLKKQSLEQQKIKEKYA
jgi:hypothetical protein